MKLVIRVVLDAEGQIMNCHGMNPEIESGTLSKTYTFTCFFDTDTKVSVPIVCK